MGSPWEVFGMFFYKKNIPCFALLCLLAMIPPRELIHNELACKSVLFRRKVLNFYWLIINVSVTFVSADLHSSPTLASTQLPPPASPHEWYRIASAEKHLAPLLCWKMTIFGPKVSHFMRPKHPNIRHKHATWGCRWGKQTESSQNRLFL